jgi:hypothetical protein
MLTLPTSPDTPNPKFDANIANSKAATDDLKSSALTMTGYIAESVHKRSNNSSKTPHNSTSIRNHRNMLCGMITCTVVRGTVKITFDPRLLSDVLTECYRFAEDIISISPSRPPAN